MLKQPYVQVSQKTREFTCRHFVLIFPQCESSAVVSAEVNVLNHLRKAQMNSSFDACQKSELVWIKKLIHDNIHDPQKMKPKQLLSAFDSPATGC